MEDASTDDSSDELCSSYTTYAKQTYEAAVKRAAEAEITLETVFSDDSSDLETRQPVKRKILKRKECKDNGKDKVRITRAKRRKELATQPAKKKGEEEMVELSSDNDSLNGLVEKDFVSSIPKTSTSRRKVNAVEDELDYDTEPEVKTDKETVTLSDSSDIEELLSSPNIKKNNVHADSNELMSIKISWRFQPIQKFQLRRHQKFKTLLEHFAKLEGVPIEQVVIHGGKDSLRSIEQYDTPDTIGITIADVLDGGILAEGSTKHSGLAKRYRDPSEADGEEIELRVQQEQMRSFPLLVKRHQKMKVLFIKVAEQLETDLNKVKLLLDGEVINPDSTPEVLGLDDGDVLDMVMA